MKYLLMYNYNWKDATDGTPIGVVDDVLVIWLEFKNISIYQINADGTISKQVKKYGTGSCWTDGEGVYIGEAFISDLPKDIEKFFQP